MNLPELMHPRNGSRVPTFHRVTFLPYDHAQLCTILKARL
eukprot:CAMPEP_0198434918 /NCGR_PEP_ID=MMETSP1452-20131203/35300_1 /TAXON_ID=1181717 /ORGANISM="Synchroma pusillum, Strain CCMP3072" /LENGTH=39 /DNA_ID= /DNA_START= /DNA_END= /DNA_ORIENTATION=